MIGSPGLTAEEDLPAYLELAQTVQISPLCQPVIGLNNLRCSEAQI